MLVQIKFTATGGCSAFGEFSPGDIAHLDAALAKHLVEEAKCAKYVTAKAAPEPEPEVAKPKQKKGR